MSAGAQVRSAVPPLAGAVRVPGDKSISHRLAILAAIGGGRSRIDGFSPAGDCAATLRALQGLGLTPLLRAGTLTIGGRGWDGLRAPTGPLDCGRSGTTLRLLAGVLAARPFRASLTGEPQLLQRPMDRVAQPLRQMGADVTLSARGRPPVAISGGDLSGIRYRLPVASAQVKSAVLLAGLQAAGETTVVEPVPTRDHTERALAWLGAPLERDGAGERRVTVRSAALPAFRASVPGDLSSAASLLAAAALVPGSDILIEGVGLNPTRTGFLSALRRMGAHVQSEPEGEEGLEPRGTVRLRHAPLGALSIDAEEVPPLIDELPLLGVVATAAEGTTVVRGAGELRVKESDRIAGLVAGLRALGADAEERPDGFAVRGPTRLRGGTCDAGGDHRLAMAFAVAALAASGPVRVQSMATVADSFPGFEEALGALVG